MMLEHRIIESGEASVASTSLVEMQQVLYLQELDETYCALTQILNFIYLCVATDSDKIDDSV